MDLLVLCPCGHPQGMHSANGCQAGRFIPCPCPFRPDEVVDAAIELAQSTHRFAPESASMAVALERRGDTDGG